MVLEDRRLTEKDSVEALGSVSNTFTDMLVSLGIEHKHFRVRLSQ